MILQCIDIEGFRGIYRLSLTLDDNNGLIGEKVWGKTSLLDALSIAFAPGAKAPAFRQQDFYQPAGDRLHLRFYFREKRA
ncbi:putative ATP-dependent endonuclease of the OLD family [Izhakiella capsodis]|uniref:Putative ATP-dependent endonuclease of the OLD family n=1 Tax=Izhakiella capsodis TaxID=1367852 RepID=A0A1I4UKS3_9GAMM|nr:DUF2813 domain-containing protein [Izhakiella capsodis]SFM89566.1 putative ATP-dependent endonuclease of the OLD family [Izhakiella capsodis]